jgi:hypothetical protein
MLVRLLYTSRAAEPVTQALIDSILAQSRAHNPEFGITGILCWSGEIFMQVLEGSRSEVNQIYHRIAIDQRHRNLVLLHYEEASERRFAGWTMGQVNLARINPSIVLKYSARPALEPDGICGRASMALLEDLIATASVIGRTG